MSFGSGSCGLHGDAVCTVNSVQSAVQIPKAADVITVSAHGGCSGLLLQRVIPVQITRSVIMIAKPGSSLTSNEDNLL